MARTQVSEDANTRVFEVTDAAGRTLWYDTELVGQAKAESDNQTAMRTAALAAIATLEQADANWGSLSAAQRDAAQRLALRVTAKLCRLTFGRLESS